MTDRPPVPRQGGGPDDPRQWLVRHKLVTGLFLAAAAFYLLSEHTAHLWGILPWLIVLACPVLHLFMHRGHGGDNGTD